MSDLLFAGPDGGRITNLNARRGADWETLREAIGRPDLRIQDLRHTFATILFDAGARASDVQATLGRSSLRSLSATCVPARASPFALAQH